ncbi:hypothetical protein DYQ86_00770 [Acidobacteria bacterium AB60]|nr:hypothetical protein DYQ86_00770 [Acidobacteria bacterium AB60]
MHTETSFEVVVHARYAEAAVLFSPEGERAWAGKHWDPQYLYNPSPGQDREGAVFTITHRGGLKATWVTARRDLEARHFQYVYFMPEIMVTTIDVRFRPINSGMTQVSVTYARTAVTAEGDEHVKVLTDGDRAAGKEWQAAIEGYLKTAHAGDPVMKR